MNAHLVMFAAVLLIAATGCARDVHATAQPADTPPSAPPAAAGPATRPSPAAYAQIAEQIESHLDRDIIRAFFPRTADHDFGGFHAGFDRAWNKLPSRGKAIVYQARQTWIASQIAMRRPDLRDEFLAHTRHGYRFLRNVMWDREYGGFFWLLDDNGQLPPNDPAEKLLYGESFGIYAASSVFQATRDPAVLEFALLAFQWLDKNAHDDANGGYFEVLARDGKPLRPDVPVAPGARFSNIGFPYNFKSMNSHIHMLEALTALYEVSKDPAVRKRLEEVFLIVRDRIAVEPGCLNLFFTPDWRPIPDHDSYGHDIETAFLLIEASEALNPEPQTPNPNDKTLRIARLLVDHTLDWGFDPARGGVYDRGFALSPAYEKQKIWWTQVEALNALLLMHEHFGQQTDRYWTAFLKQWDFIRRHQIDPEHPGLFEAVEPDGRPAATNKSHNWKAAYHDGRAFLLATQRLRHLAKTE